LNVYISQGSVATQLRCRPSEIFNNYLIANCPQSVPVKNLENRSIFGEDMDNDKVWEFLSRHRVGLYIHAAETEPLSTGPKQLTVDKAGVGRQRAMSPWLMMMMMMISCRWFDDTQ